MRRPAWSIVGDVALGLAVVVVIATILSLRLGPVPLSQPAAAPTITSTLPRPIPQPITRTDPAAQVAWVATQADTRGATRLIGVDPAGKIIGSIDTSGPALRSGDGTSILVIGNDRQCPATQGATCVVRYLAPAGSLSPAYPLPTRVSGAVAATAASSDGRWTAILVAGANPKLQLVDLQGGDLGQLVVPIRHDPSALLPGLSGDTQGAVWGTVAFAPDSQHLYTLTDWGGPLRLTAFIVSQARIAPQLTETGSVVSGEGGRRFPTCAGPAMAARVVGEGRTLVAFCHVDGAVWFFDLPSLTLLGTVQTSQKNPFWLSPIYTPDGQLLYLHQWPAFGDEMQVIDLATRKLLGPVPTPRSIGGPGPFSGLFSVAYAGGTASTMPISPDGLWLYSATADGVVVLRVPDLAPVAHLASGRPTNEVWVSGDGGTIYATSLDGKSLLVIAAQGGSVHVVPLSGTAFGFIASEHG
jgi:hypothetical protein